MSRLTHFFRIMREDQAFLMTANHFTAYQASFLRQHLKQAGHSTNSSQVIARTFEWLKYPNSHLVTLGHEHYPGVLRELADPPPVLYGMGNWQTFAKPAAAIVGARQCTPRAAAHAFRLAKDIASRGWCVVSGLARGIDSAAHRGALASGVPDCTIAVLGTGVDIIYPPQNDTLARQIVESGGLLLSEFTLASPPLPKHFPQRNRIVAALGRATIIAQAKLRSGTMITAGLAAEMGREVLAVPGAPDEPLSEGPNALIRQGASLIEDEHDLWSAFGLYGQMRSSNLESGQP